MFLTDLGGLEGWKGGCCKFKFFVVNNFFLGYLINNLAWSSQYVS